MTRIKMAAWMASAALVGAPAWAETLYNEDGIRV